MSFQSNSCLLGVNLLKLCFITVSEIVRNEVKSVRKLKVRNKTSECFGSNVSYSPSIFAGLLFCGRGRHFIRSSLHCVCVCGISHDATGEANF